MTTPFRTFATIAALGTALATSACETPRAGAGRRTMPPPAMRGATDGAVGGYLLGDILGGRRDRTARIVAAGISGTASGAIGSYMDAQEAELRAQLVGSAVQVTRRGDDLILTIPAALSFAYKSDAIAPDFQHPLDQIARVLHRYDRAFVDIYGHSDATGSDVYNQGLSQRRAAAVAAYFAARGVHPARLATTAFGKRQPIAANTTPEGQAANRRVEIKIVPIADTDLR